MPAPLHYHVVENTPGYLPEDDSPFCTYDLNAAEAEAKNLAESYVESVWNEEEPEASPEIVSMGRDATGALIGYRIVSPDAYTLDRVVEIIPCMEQECIPVEV